MPELYISVMTTLGGIGMVTYITMLMYLVLAWWNRSATLLLRQSKYRDLLRLATANTSTTCCCEHVGNTAAAHMNNPI